MGINELFDEWPKKAMQRFTLNPITYKQLIMYSIYFPIC